MGAVRGYPCYEFCNVVLWKNSKSVYITHGAAAVGL
nr:MAG TPA: hypothetical protein [Caudoviricetes sp.]